MTGLAVAADMFEDPALSTDLLRLLGAELACHGV